MKYLFETMGDCQSSNGIQNMKQIVSFDKFSIKHLLKYPTNI